MLSNMPMSKDQIRAMLAEQVNQYVQQGGEIVRYASLSSMNIPEKIKLTNERKIPNLKQQEWERYLESLQDGTYQADEFKQEPLRHTRERYRVSL